MARCFTTAVLLACLTATLAQLPTDFQVSQFTSGAGALSLLDGLSRLGTMVPTERHAALMVLGEVVKGQLHTQCNVFGGSGSCMAIDSGSPLAKMCPGVEPRVDCLYYSEDLLDMKQTPVDRFREELASQGYKDIEKYCPECMDNLHKVWCTQALPKCGTFDALLDRAVFPALQLAGGAASKDNASGSADAAKDAKQALPDGWAAEFQRNVSLLLPCREMCEAVVSTCGCNQQRTFGDVVKGLLPKAGGSDGGVAPMVESLLDDWSGRGICELFAYRGEAGFQGHCMELPATCRKQHDWCSREGGQEGAGDPEKLMLGPVVRAIFGWDDSRKDGDLDRYVVHSGDGSVPGDSTSGGSTALLVLLSVLLALALGALVVIGGLWYWRTYLQRDQLDYVHMVELNSSDPLVL